MEFFKSFYSSLIKVGNFLQSFILLAMRLFWGWQFFSTGFNKLSDISPIIEYFQSLGIPLPTLNAYLVASIECVGGLCLMLGLASRLVSIPLMIVMVGALLTAYPDTISKIVEDPLSVAALTPFTFLLTSLIVFAFGPGIFSLDALFKRLFFKNNVK